MSAKNWKQGWRLWSPRCYAEALDTRNGDRLVLKLRHRGRGVCYDRFGPNVGQPNPRPAVHPHHRDIPEMADGLELGCWSQDGCYELILDRPEVKARLILADSRSLACGPSDDPVMRQGVLIGVVQLEYLARNVALWFETRGGGEAPLRKISLGGSCEVKGGKIRILPGENIFAVGRMPATINSEKAHKRVRKMRSFVRHFGQAQLSGPQRMGHAVRWNTCFDRGRQDIFPAVNRAWVEMMARISGLPELRRGPLIFGWDAAISTLLVARSDHSLARNMVRAVLARQQPDGRLPTMSLGPHDADRMAPLLLPLAAWYLCYDGGWEFAAEVLPALRRAHRWVMDSRQPRGDGLLTWGNDAHKQGPLRIDGWVGAAYESGLDNSPMWEEMGWDGRRLSLGRASVDLCSMAALSARVLAELCRRTGEDPAPYVADYRRIYRAVNSRLWGDDGLYHNLRHDGTLARRVSPTSFYPLLAGLVPKGRATRMIRERLFNRDAFWGQPVIPSVPRDSSAYDGDGDYWRGRVWPPMNYLVWAGLRQYSPADAAHLAEHCRILFDEEWERHGHLHENYSAITGGGEPMTGTYARSCPFYSWGGLLLLPYVEGKTGGAIVRLPRIEA